VCQRNLIRLAVTIFITLLLASAFYPIFVLDLRWITWEFTTKET
jgi:hypothetical protein